MRTYVLAPTGEGRGEKALEDALRASLPRDIPVRIDLQHGEVRVGADADPQAVVFAIESAGYPVSSVEEVRS
ncbi:copper chaperone [Alsobacter soli]|uniref:Copper chaperone n=1 Tax=Alsobacter soli TaxID=2109933 RepID=A0A2T1HMN3_9HYPH|nr:copper chaperone [Alsobacter soli]PSC02924.1 copper chaperone [Alsobacter soli]